MELPINVVLPLSLAIIMLSLSIGLTLGDFKRVFTDFMALAIGAGSLVIFLPAVAHFSDMALPPAAYGILVYFVTAPFVTWYRRT